MNIIELKENYNTVDLFPLLKKRGDVVNVPYDPKRHNGIKAEANRRNADIRKRFRKSMPFKPKTYGVYKSKYPGYTTIIKEL